MRPNLPTIGENTTNGNTCIRRPIISKNIPHMIPTILHIHLETGEVSGNLSSWVHGRSVEVNQQSVRIL